MAALNPKSYDLWTFQYLLCFYNMANSTNKKQIFVEILAWIRIFPTLKHKNISAKSSTAENMYILLLHLCWLRNQVGSQNCASGTKRYFAMKGPTCLSNYQKISSAHEIGVLRMFGRRLEGICSVVSRKVSFLILGWPFAPHPHLLRINEVFSSFYQFLRLMLNGCCNTCVFLFN